MDRMILEKRLRVICKKCGEPHYVGKWETCPKCGETVIFDIDKMEEIGGHGH